MPTGRPMSQYRKILMGHVRLEKSKGEAFVFLVGGDCICRSPNSFLRMRRRSIHPGPAGIHLGRSAKPRHHVCTRALTQQP